MKLQQYFSQSWGIRRNNWLKMDVFIVKKVEWISYFFCWWYDDFIRCAITIFSIDRKQDNIFFQEVCCQVDEYFITPCSIFFHRCQPIIWSRDFPFFIIWQYVNYLLRLKPNVLCIFIICIFFCAIYFFVSNIFYGCAYLLKLAIAGRFLYSFLIEKLAVGWF